MFYALPVLVMSSLQRLRSATKGGSAQVCKHVTWHKYSYGSSQKAAQVFAPAGFDMEIVEKHHNLKLDAPSGTALALADSINEAMDNEYHYVYDRSQRREKRDPKEIGISAVRGGSIVGEHEVLFCGQDEVIEFKHTAYSKAVFAKGAVEAAKFLKGKGCRSLRYGGCYCS